jgi:hypothetical protein
VQNTLKITTAQRVEQVLTKALLSFDTAGTISQAVRIPNCLTIKLVTLTGFEPCFRLKCPLAFRVSLVSRIKAQAKHKQSFWYLAGTV